MNTLKAILKGTIKRAFKSTHLKQSLKGPLKEPSLKVLLNLGQDRFSPGSGKRPGTPEPTMRNQKFPRFFMKGFVFT